MLKKLNLAKNWVAQFLIVLLAISLLSRFLYLDFGLPYVLQADEAEMAEYSLKYAVNLKKLFEGDFVFFKPFSFVYGSLPAYLNTFLLVPFLKITQILNLSQDRYYIYLYLRVWSVLFTIFACFGVFLLAKQITKNQVISLLSALLFSLNFYFLWLSKYLNNDVLIVFFTIYFLYFYLKYQETKKNKDLYYSLLFVGLGISTKITFGLVFIYPFIELILKKDFKKLFYGCGIIFGTYLITNPFTFIFPLEFWGRIMEMRVKENGIVIDSYNTSYFKYLISLIDNLTAPVVVLGLTKIFKDLTKKKFYISSYIIIIFVVFFTFSSRIVDRWVLPIYPLLIINFFMILDYIKYKYLKEIIIGIVFFLSFNQFIQTNIELSAGSNLAKAYLDFINNHVEAGKTVYIVTERGLNPFGYVIRKQMFYAQAPVNLYVSDRGFESFPDNPSNYDFVVFSTKVRSYYLNPYIYELNSNYVNKWEDFYKQLLDQQKFEVLGFYGSMQKSLINQENIIVFKKK